MPPKPICLVTFQTVHEAHIARSVLEAHGIPSVVTGDQLATTLAWYGNAIKRIELLVEPDRSEEAASILRELAPAGQHQHVWGTAPPMDWRCPDCEESNANSFDHCWSCGHDRPEHAELVSSEEARDVMPPPAPGVNLVAPAIEDDSPYRVPQYQNVPMPTLSTTPQTHLQIKALGDRDLPTRALRAACFGLVMPIPLSYYSLYLCLRYLHQGKVTGKVLLAMALSFPLALAFTIGAAIEFLSYLRLPF